MFVASAVAQAVKLNQPFWLGDCQYTFTGAKESKELIRNKYSKKAPSEGAGFLVVYYTIENMTHEPMTMFHALDHMKLRVKDKNGRTYNAKDQ